MQKQRVQNGRYCSNPSKKIEKTKSYSNNAKLLFYPSGVIILITNGLTPKNPNT
jgi:hypothetical protein